MITENESVGVQTKFIPTIEEILDYCTKSNYHLDAGNEFYGVNKQKWDEGFKNPKYWKQSLTAFWRDHPKNTRNQASYNRPDEMNHSVTNDFSLNIKRTSGDRSYKSYSEKLKDPRWQKKRLEILEAGNWTCQDCGEKSKELHAHHGWYEKGVEPWDYEDYCYSVLCDECHALWHKSKAHLDRTIALIGPSNLDALVRLIDYQAEGFGLTTTQVIQVLIKTLYSKENFHVAAKCALSDSFGNKPTLLEIIQIIREFNKSKNP